MSGLSEAERIGCRKILSLMSKGDLFSLSDTVTNKLIVVENATEATEAILSFSQNAEELLRRKKVLREIIFKYLANDGIVMSPNTEKHQLVKRTLAHWSAGKAVCLQGEIDGPCTESSVPAASDSTNANTEVGVDPLVLGQQFCKWFFQLLNSQNPSLGQPPQDWGPQHFWPNVRLRLFSSADSEQTDEFLGAELVHQRLLALTKEERLLFNPNLEPRGLKVVASPHSLVKVAVAGTIHRDEACLGIFEQIFGLIRSPLENNSWKIQHVDLKIRGQDALGGTEVVPPALSLTSTELQLLCS